MNIKKILTISLFFRVYLIFTIFLFVLTLLFYHISHAECHNIHNTFFPSLKKIKAYFSMGGGYVYGRTLFQTIVYCVTQKVNRMPFGCGAPINYL